MQIEERMQTVEKLQAVMQVNIEHILAKMDDMITQLRIQNEKMPEFLLIERRLSLTETQLATLQSGVEEIKRADLIQQTRNNTIINAITKTPWKAIFIMLALVIAFISGRHDLIPFLPQIEHNKAHQ